MQKMVDRTIGLDKFDAIYIHLFRMAQFVQHHNNIYRILDLTDVISHEISRSLPYRNLFWRLLYSIECDRIQNYEKELTDNFEEIWLISVADLNILSSQSPDANIKLLPNGVDIDTFHPDHSKPIPLRIIFTGHMGVYHNIDAAQYFASEVFPAIQKAFPKSVFVIAGAEPAQAILDLKTQRNVKVLGYVENLNKELNSSQVFVAPLRFAAGVQNKVLEALAAGIPVIATSIVNEGLNAEVGKEIIIADSPDEFITQITKLFQENLYRKKIASGGLNFVKDNYSWDIVLHRINTIEHNLLGKNITLNNHNNYPRRNQ
jgi:glycosyltransferase involved in cell wall biosynthesis